MVDGFDTTIPLVLQWVAGMFCLLAAIAAGNCSRSNVRRVVLRAWSVLSGLSQQVLLQNRDVRFLLISCCVPVPLRAGPCPADYRHHHRDRQTGVFLPDLWSPSN